MDARNLLKFLVFSFGIALVILTTWFHLPSSLLNKEALDCNIYSGWCTSKNRFQSSNPITKPTFSPRRQHPYHESDEPRHPLDPLTIQEFNKVRAILSTHTLFKSSNSYTLNSIVLEEPDKELVLKWKKGEPLLPRKASVVALVKGVTHTLIVDLSRSEITNHETRPASSGYPTMTIEEMLAVLDVPLKSGEFNSTIRKRGVNLADLACLPVASGWYGTPVEENRRLIKVQCYSSKDTVNFYMKPIEGLTVLVDMDRKEVVSITDNGLNIPVANGIDTDYRYSVQKLNGELNLINPISLEQPKGPSFTVDGHLVKWANWEFHLKPDPRAGTIISQAKVRDPDTLEMRNVIYKGFTSELFVPYMDPTDGWYFKTYMDAGEYGFGLQAMPLDPLNDCPRNAYYMDGVFASADGTPFVQPNMICIFESYAGDIAWRHAECPITDMKVRISVLMNDTITVLLQIHQTRNVKSSIFESYTLINYFEFMLLWQVTEVRPKVTLVVRMAAAVANYDYIMDWEFQTDGLIRSKVGDENSVYLV